MTNQFMRRLLLLGVTVGVIACSSVAGAPLGRLRADAPAIAPAAETTFYVATDGSDSSPGSQDRPWRTIQHAADRLSPGETVYVRAGTYQESVSLTRSGVPGNPITFAALPGEIVILDGRERLRYGFTTDSKQSISDLTITGFTIRSFAANGIAAWSTNDRLTLTNLVIEQNGDFGIMVSNGDGIRVQNVLLQHNLGGFSCSPIVPPSGPGCTNLYISDSQAIDNGKGDDTGYDAFAVEKGDSILVERSLATGGPGDGFDFKSERTTLSQIIASNTRNNVKLWGKNSTLVNALLYDARADANLVLASGGSYTVTNVTIANMTSHAYLTTIGDPHAAGATPVTLQNTIFYNDNPAMGGTLLWLGPDIQLLAGNNLFYNPFRSDDVICAEFTPYAGRCFSASDIEAGVPMMPGSRSSDPKFADPSNKDFHLSPGSPAVDRGGRANAPAVDLDSSARENLPDIGAYEYHGP